MGLADTLYRPCMFWKPDREAPSAWAQHVPFAFWLVDVVRPATIVELGTHHGVSYSAMCQAVKTLDLPTRCFAVDTWAGDDHAGEYGEEVFEGLAKFNRRYGAFSNLIRSTFDDALQYFADGTIDILHIDGLHSYEAVRHDFESWLPKMSASGVVLFHDINVRERGFGVFRLWDEISADRQHFAFLHGNGLGVLGLSKQPSLPLLFEAGAAETAQIRAIFEHLGQAAELSYLETTRKVEIARLQALVEQLLASVQRVEGALHSQEAETSRVVGLYEAERAAAAAAALALEEARASYAKQMSISEQLQIERDGHKGQCDVYAGQIAQIGASLEELRGSTSWRVTAPLRAISRLTRNLQLRA